MDGTVLIILALPIAFLLSTILWTNQSTSQIAVEHREHVRQVRERVLLERLNRQGDGPTQRAQRRPAVNVSQSDNDAYNFAPEPERAPPSRPSVNPEQSSAYSADSESRAEASCPICLDTPTFAVETNCGHIYCTDCLIEYYNRGGSGLMLQPVSCPCCRRRVDSLVTKYTDAEKADSQMREKLLIVQDYNRKHSNEPRSINERVRDAPHLIRRLGRELFNSPGSVIRLLFGSHFILSFLVTFLYVISPIDILPEMALGALGFVDDAIVLVGFCVVLSSIYRTVTLGRMAQPMNA